MRADKTKTDWNSILVGFAAALSVALVVGGGLYAIWTSPNVTIGGALVLTGLIMACITFVLALICFTE